MWQTLAVKVLEFVLMAVLERLIKNPKTPYDDALKDTIKEAEDTASTLRNRLNSM